MALVIFMLASPGSEVLNPRLYPARDGGDHRPPSATGHRKQQLDLGVKQADERSSCESQGSEGWSDFSELEGRDEGARGRGKRLSNGREPGSGNVGTPACRRTPSHPTQVG